MPQRWTSERPAPAAGSFAGCVPARWRRCGWQARLVPVRMERPSRSRVTRSSRRSESMRACDGTPPRTRPRTTCSRARAASQALLQRHGLPEPGLLLEILSPSVPDRLVGDPEIERDVRPSRVLHFDSHTTDPRNCRSFERLSIAADVDGIPRPDLVGTFDVGHVPLLSVGRKLLTPIFPLSVI